MGCTGSKASKPAGGSFSTYSRNYKWQADPPVSKEGVEAMRATFWDTQPMYGGSKEIWDALKAASEAEDMATTRLIIEAAGIKVHSKDLTECFDERGVKYDLPKYVWCDPTNLIKG